MPNSVVWKKVELFILHFYGILQTSNVPLINIFLPKKYNFTLPTILKTVCTVINN